MTIIVDLVLAYSGCSCTVTYTAIAHRVHRSHQCRYRHWWLE